MTVTTRRCFRWSVRIFARCLEGGSQVGFATSGGQSHDSMGRSHRSHVGGMSNGVPAKSLDMDFYGYLSAGLVDSLSAALHTGSYSGSWLFFKLGIDETFAAGMMMGNELTG